MNSINNIDIVLECLSKLERHWITIEECVYKLLTLEGLNPPQFFPFYKNGNEEENEVADEETLFEFLEENYESADSEYVEAKIEDPPLSEAVINEKKENKEKSKKILSKARYFERLIVDEIAKNALRKTPVIGYVRHDDSITVNSFIDWIGEYSKMEEIRSPNANSPRISLMRIQEEEIIEKIIELGYEPNALPKRQPGKEWVKSNVKKCLDGSYPFKSKKSFNATWDRLRSDKKIKEAY